MQSTSAARDGTAASAADVELEILSIGWERIQLVIRARPVVRTRPDGAGLAALPLAHEFRLERLGRHSPTMPATRVRPDGDAVLVRFNVMSGPDLDPLEPGRWTLTTGPAAALIGAATVPTGGTTNADPDRAPGHGAVAGRPVRIVDPRGLVGAAGRRTYDVERDDALLTLAYDTVLDPVGSRFVLIVSFARRRDDGSSPADATSPGAGSRGRTIGARLRSTRATAFTRAFAAIARRIPHDGRRILFTSDSRAELSGNLALVHDRMIERGLDRDRTFTTIVRPTRRERRGIIGRLRIVWALLRADVIVIDDYQPIIYRLDFPPGVRVIQLWHASGAFKTVGYSRIGKEGGPEPWSRAHKNYTHAIVSSDADVPFYAEAFGIPEARVVSTGIPRMDRYFDEASRAAGRAAAYREYPMAEGRRTILFAPTFRGDGATTATYDLAWLDYDALHALAVEQDAVVLIRMHPFVTETLGVPEAYRDRLIDGSGSSIDVNDLLFAVDVLVTDYSSIIFEFSTFRRPMLFYAPDLDEYIASRDFYEPFEPFVPGRIVRDMDALIEALRAVDLGAADSRTSDAADVADVDRFAHRHFAHLDGQSTDRVIDDVVLGGL